MSIGGLVLVLLILAALTGGVTFSGFLAGSAFLIIFQILFPIFAILFVIALIKLIFFPEPKV